MDEPWHVSSGHTQGRADTAKRGIGTGFFGKNARIESSHRSKRREGRMVLIIIINYFTGMKRTFNILLLAISNNFYNSLKLT
jgi:hypothetical protein